jgi:hypothetical protein
VKNAPPNESSCGVCKPAGLRSRMAQMRFRRHLTVLSLISVFRSSPSQNDAIRLHGRTGVGAAAAPFRRYGVCSSRVPRLSGAVLLRWRMA